MRNFIYRNRTAISYGYLENGIGLKIKLSEDSSWVSSYNKKSIAEKPVIVDTTLARETAITMQNYLRNKKGYYNAEVDYNYCVCRKNGILSYLIDPKRRYGINSLEYYSLDSTLTSELPIVESKSFLNISDPLDALVFDLEKQRIVNHMRNRGYANFNLNHVGIKGDSTGLDHAWDVFIEIRPPSDSTTHKKYRIGQIDIYTDYHQFQNESSLSFQAIFWE